MYFAGGVERQGSYYGDDVTQKATVAMVVDDPEQKEQMNSIFDAGRTVFFILFHRKKFRVFPTLFFVDFQNLPVVSVYLIWPIKEPILEALKYTVYIFFASFLMVNVTKP